MFIMNPISGQDLIRPDSDDLFLCLLINQDISYFLGFSSLYLVFGIVSASHLTHNSDDSFAINLGPF